MKKRLLLIITIILFVANPLWAKNGAYIDLGKVSVPRGLGTVKEFYQSPVSGKRASKIIFHIQDVHANYEAQKSLANILEYLIKTYGVNLILVEGGITDKDFSYIREWAPLEERKIKADELLRDGVITGETYVDIASDLPLKFQGIENKKLYEQNMETYLKVDFFRNDALSIVEDFTSVVEKLKKYIYTKRLKEYDKNKKKYKSEEMELVEYVKYLDDVASREGVDLVTYPNHSILLETVKLEEEIDFDEVEEERDDLIKKLDSILTKDFLNELLVKSVKFKEGKITSGKFYLFLRDLSVQHKVDMDNYKNLDDYVDYITQYEKLKGEELFKEINEIDDKISDVLCRNNEQRTLFKISKNLLVLEMFLRLKLAPEDFAYYKANKKDFNLKDWKKFLKRHFERFKLNIDVPEDTSAIDDNFGILEKFYKLAFKRDKAFLQNSLLKMEKEKAKTAFLIAGGFHTNNLTRLFKAKEISYIVVTPKFRQKTEDRVYDRILKESYKTRIWD